MVDENGEVENIKGFEICFQFKTVKQIMHFVLGK